MASFKTIQHKKIRHSRYERWRALLDSRRPFLEEYFVHIDEAQSPPQSSSTSHEMDAAKSHTAP